MNHTITLTVIERAAPDETWRFDRVSTLPPEKAIRSWLEKHYASSAPIGHDMAAGAYFPQVRFRPPIRARRVQVEVPGAQAESLARRLAKACLGLVVGLLRLMVPHPTRDATSRWKRSYRRRR